MEFPSIQACAIRVTRLDGSGVPDPGANNMYQSHAIVELTSTPVVQEGTEITVPNGQGHNCATYKEDDQITRATIELSICKPDAELTEILAGGDVLDLGDIKGYAAPPLGTFERRNGVSIELWSKRIDGEDLAEDFPYFWWVWPRVKSIRLGQRRYFNGGLENPFQGNAIENPNWFDGPLNDWPGEISDRWFQYVPTNSLPDDVSGYLPVAAS